MLKLFFLGRKLWAVEWGGHFARAVPRIKSPSVPLALLPPLQMLGPATGGREGARGRHFCGAGKSHVLPAAPQGSQMGRNGSEALWPWLPFTESSWNSMKVIGFL